MLLVLRGNILQPHPRDAPPVLRRPQRPLDLRRPRLHRRREPHVRRVVVVEGGLGRLGRRRPPPPRGTADALVHLVVGVGLRQVLLLPLPAPVAGAPVVVIRVEAVDAAAVDHLVVVEAVII